MKSLKKYSIPFTGLALGKHHFEFDITDSFFEEFDYSLVKHGSLKCNVELDRQETMLILNFAVKGTIKLNCDRCLTEFDQPVEFHEQQIAKFSEEEIGEDDEIITLGKNDHEISIAGLLYEYINVAVPFIALCENAGIECDKEMLDSLNKLAANDDNNETNDPRWDALKKIK